MTLTGGVWPCLWRAALSPTGRVCSLLYYVLFFFFFITSIILYSYRSSIWRLMHGYYNRIDWKQLRGYMHACALYIVLFSCSFSSTFIYLSHFPNRKHTHTSKQAFTNIVVSSQIKAKFTFSGLHNCKYIKCTWKPALTHMWFFFVMSQFSCHSQPILQPCTYFRVFDIHHDLNAETHHYMKTCLKNVFLRC